MRGDLVAITAGLSAVSELGGMFFGSQAEEQQERALQLQSKESLLQYQQKQLSNYDLLQKTLDAQVAAQTTTGLSFDSPSFNAIQRDTYNTGMKMMKNTKLEEDINQANIETEKQNVRSKLWSSLFGGAADIGFGIANVVSNSPKRKR